MKKLPANFGLCFDEINIFFTYPLSKANICQNKIFDKKQNYQINIKKFRSINLLYKKINNVLKKYKCEVYDLNNVIHNYSIKTKHTKLICDLKQFMIDRNKMIIYQLLKSKQWNAYLNKLKYDIDPLFINKISISDIENGILNLFKNYNNKWVGYSPIIKITNNCEIKNIEIFDYVLYNKLIIFIANKNKWAIKDAQIKKKLQLFEKKFN